MHRKGVFQMNKKTTFSFISLLAAFIVVAVVVKIKFMPTNLNLTLQTLDGANLSLDDIPSDKKVVVLFVQGNGCPIVRKSLRSFENLRKKTPESQVAFYLINSNPQDSLNDVKQELKEFDVQAPTLKDSKQEFMKKMGVTRTAHLFILERDGWKIRYSGSLDQSLHYEGSRGSSDLSLPEKVLGDVLEGKSGEIETSEVKDYLIGSL